MDNETKQAIFQDLNYWYHEAAGEVDFGDLLSQNTHYPGAVACLMLEYFLEEEEAKAIFEEWKTERAEK